MADREYVSFKPNGGDAEIITSLNNKRKRAADLDDLAYENPAALSQQIEIYSFMLADIGDLYAQSVYRHKKAYADRKRGHGVENQKKEGTIASRAANAEVLCYEMRVRESECMAEMEHWNKAYSSLQEIINAKKKSLDVLCAHFFGKANK